MTTPASITMRGRYRARAMEQLLLPRHGAQPDGPDRGPGRGYGQDAPITLNEELAGEIAQLIEAGVLRPGEKIPSVRAMCGQRKISQATVLLAYHRLEDRGLIQTRPRSGYYVSGHWKDLPREPEISHPALGTTEIDISDLVFEVLGAVKSRQVVPLGSAFPSPLLFPLTKLSKLLGSAARKLDPWATVRDLSPGSWELRRQIAKRYLTTGVHVPLDEIVVTAGAMEALNLCLQAVTQRGDIVAVESPAFYAGLQAIERLGLRAIEIPTHPREGVDLAALEQALAKNDIKACWFMPSFQNPLGSLMPDAKRKALVELLEPHGVPLIEDDVYAELHFGAQPATPAKAFDRAGLVLHCGSFSKCLAPGYRIGWAAPGRFMRQVSRLKLMTSVATNIPAQEALAQYLKQGGYEHHLRQLRHTLQAQQNDLLLALGEQFPPGTRITRPQGGYFLWVELPEHVDTLNLHRQAASLGISISPGPMFSATRGYKNCMRLNYGHPWSPQIADAVATLGQLIKQAG